MPFARTTLSRKGASAASSASPLRAVGPCQAIPRSASSSPSAPSHGADAEHQQVFRRQRRADRLEMRGEAVAAQSVRHRRPVKVAARGRRQRVASGCGVDPQREERPAEPRRALGEARQRAERQAVIAAEKDRQRVGLHPARRRADGARPGRDLRQGLEAGQAMRAASAVRREIAPVDGGAPRARDAARRPAALSAIGPASQPPLPAPSPTGAPIRMATMPVSCFSAEKAMETGRSEHDIPLE